MSGQVELRCPKHDRRMFGKITETDDPEFQVEVACRDCRSRGVSLVLHVFDGHGQCVDTFTLGR